MWMIPSHFAEIDAWCRHSDTRSNLGNGEATLDPSIAKMAGKT
jgi:hypothetical protein